MGGEWIGGGGDYERMERRERVAGRWRCVGVGGFEISSVSLLSLPYQHDCQAAL